MFAFKLIQLIETRAEALSEGLLRRIKTDDRCAEILRRVPSDELRRRPQEMYRNLNDWLRNTSPPAGTSYSILIATFIAPPRLSANTS